MPRGIVSRLVPAQRHTSFGKELRGRQIADAMFVVYRQRFGRLPGDVRRAGGHIEQSASKMEV